MVARERFRADVEGLRAVAILAVVLYHAGLGATGGGYVGVDVFYVLSGFLITGLLWDELRQTGGLSFASFYARRARRLLPAALLVVVVTVIASGLWLSPLWAQVVTRDAIASTLYVANYRFAALRTDYLAADAPPSPLQHYWSLGVEEQFYLVWPLLLVMASLAWRRAGGASPAPAVATVVVVGAASFALSLRLTEVSQPWAFFSLPTRAWELAVGGLVALSARRLARLPGPAAVTLGWLGMGAIGWSVVRLGGSTPFPGTAALLPVGGTAAVVAAGCSAARFGPAMLLARRPLQLGGKLSYSWYLWHWPLLVLAPAVVGHALGLVPKLALGAFSALLALATLKLVEDPVRFSPRLRARPGRSLAAGATLTAVATVASIAAANSLPAPRGHGAAATPGRIPIAASRISRVPEGTAAAAVTRLQAAAAPVERAVAGAVAERAVPSNLNPSLERAHHDQARPFLDGCDDGWRDTRVVPCAYGDRRSTTTVVLFGDSHAPQWFPAFERVAAARHWRLVSLSKATCPPVEISVWSPVLGRPFRECDQWRAAAIQWIHAERPALVVLGAARHYSSAYHFGMYGPAWTSGLAGMVGRLRATGARVLV
ncbi:MAG TPA: acyltransferase family protein, partial [Actinomycetes bacterium]|nr:acyltransferase family protein [Actinomycetes bacterium]